MKNPHVLNIDLHYFRKELCYLKNRNLVRYKINVIFIFLTQA